MKTKRTTRCSWCGRGGFTLTPAGTFRNHNRYTRAESGEMPPQCAGSGRAPREYRKQKRS